MADRPPKWAEALQVRCPRCHKPAKAKCISLKTGNPKRWVHPERQRLYDETKDPHDRGRVHQH